MLTYGDYECGRIIRKEVTEKEVITLWYEIDEKMNALDNDEFSNLIELIGDYVWAMTGERRNAANRLRPHAKKMGFTIYELEMWYCIEE